jgi:hypothetical protein
MLLKEFFRWYSYTARGKKSKNGRLVMISFLNYAERLFRGFKEDVDMNMHECMHKPRKPSNSTECRARDDDPQRLMPIDPIMGKSFNTLCRLCLLKEAFMDEIQRKETQQHRST